MLQTDFPYAIVQEIFYQPVHLCLATLELDLPSISCVKLSCWVLQSYSKLEMP